MVDQEHRQRKCVKCALQIRGLDRTLYHMPYTFPPTKTSTLAQSNFFHVASPIHALLSPR